jgi:hypothetical protein
MSSTDTGHVLPSSELPPAGAPAPGRSRRRRTTYGRILFEATLITLGVFLALLGNEWRERAGHRQLAEDTLRRFRAEFTANRGAVAAVTDKHVESLERIRDYFTADPATQSKMGYPFMATDPAFLEYTAWGLALATQALSHVDPDLAQEAAHVYAVQRQLDEATRDITLVMYARAGDADPVPLTRSLATYFGDCTLIEPRLLRLYDEILQMADATTMGAAATRMGVERMCSSPKNTAEAWKVAACPTSMRGTARRTAGRDDVAGLDVWAVCEGCAPLPSEADCRRGHHFFPEHVRDVDL